MNPEGNYKDDKQDGKWTQWYENPNFFSSVRGDVYIYPRGQKKFIF